MVVACDTVETYSPAMQDTIDNVLFRTLDSRAVENQDGSFIIQEAISGNITIIEHNLNAKTIKGTFSFLTPTKSIALSQFNIAY